MGWIFLAQQLLISAALKFQARCLNWICEFLPWIAAACSLVMKSAGLGGGVFDTFGDFGSASVITTYNASYAHFYKNKALPIDREISLKRHINVGHSFKFSTSSTIEPADVMVN